MTSRTQPGQIPDLALADIHSFPVLCRKTSAIHQPVCAGLSGRGCTSPSACGLQTWSTFGKTYVCCKITSWLQLPSGWGWRWDTLWIVALTEVWDMVWSFHSAFFWQLQQTPQRFGRVVLSGDNCCLCYGGSTWGMSNLPGSAWPWLWEPNIQVSEHPRLQP